MQFLQGGGARYHPARYPARTADERRLTWAQTGRLPEGTSSKNRVHDVVIM